MKRFRLLLLSLAILLLSSFTSSAAAQEQREREGARGRGPAGMLRSFPLMLALDENSDGELSEEEIEEAIEHLKELDANKDGKLSGNELAPAGGPGGGRGEGPRGEGGGNSTELAEQLMKNDKNGDGKLTKDELPGRLQAIIERSDSDKDGVLTREEIINSARQQGRAQGGPAGRPGNMGPPTGGNPEALLRRFLGFDKDGDGKLSREELERALMSNQAPGGREGRESPERRQPREEEEDDDDDDDLPR